MKPLTVEINGTGTHNRGAELMAIAIGERMRASFPGVQIVVPRHFGKPADRSRHGFLAVADPLGGARSRVAGWVIGNLGSKIRASMGFVRPREIDIILDASGFAFSDQWGAGAAQSLVAKMARPDRKGKPLILLPQALGPFSDPEVASASRAVFELADLVCARDERSHASAEALMDSRKLRLYPDFTLGVKPLLPRSIGLPASFAGIVPNYRMLDKTGTAEQYLRFLLVTIDLLSSAGMNPVFVLHDAAEDRLVIDRVQKERRIAVFEHSDPRVLKGILGRADLVVGSRFHALVSSLSQGVPCIGAGWSHKYPELFRDFGVPELLVGDLTDTARVAEIVCSLETPETRETYRERIVHAGNVLTESTEGMWREVETLIRNRVSTT